MVDLSLRRNVESDHPSLRRGPVSSLTIPSWPWRILRRAICKKRQLNAPCKKLNPTDQSVDYYKMLSFPLIPVIGSLFPSLVWLRICRNEGLPSGSIVRDQAMGVVVSGS